MQALRFPAFVIVWKKKRSIDILNEFFHVDMNTLSSYRIFEGMYMIWAFM